MRIVHRGSEITSQLQGRLRDFVALLLLQPADTPLTRAAIAARLWPDTSESQALTNVRNLLHKLRTAWPAIVDLLEVTRQAVHWKPSASLWLDVHAFERGVDEAGHLTGSAAINLLRTSLALYRGDLLPGSNEEWLLPTQERLHERYLQALGQLADLLIEQQDFTTALHYAQLLVIAAPLREEAHRHLIRAYALAGDAGAARQAHADCAAMLAREFDAPPSAATEDVYRQYIAGR
jgi:DNA-binding SARP family transcriptional activator